jgi:MFS family permease
MRERPILRLIAAVVLATSPWFAATAALADLARTAGVDATALAGLATATQIGFVAGGLALAFSGLADRSDPRHLFALGAVAAAALNLALLGVPADGALAWLSRAGLGAALAGVYPVALKLAVTWQRERSARLAGVLVGALTLGSATP